MKIEKSIINLLFVFIFLSGYAFGEVFSEKDIPQIIQSAKTIKFTRYYKGKDIRVKGIFSIFDNEEKDFMWFVIKVDNYFVSCHVNRKITKYDNLKKGETLILNGTIGDVGLFYGQKEVINLTLEDGCTIYKN